MPEIKNIFTSGKMNKDLDERLVPKGEYLEAMNINIVSSEGTDVGSVTNLKGNTKVVTTTITSPTIVGKFVDTENDKIILFVSGSAYSSSDQNSGIDTIIEYDPTTGKIAPIITDIYKGRPGSATISGEVLKFNDDNFITGINILNGILFWTDNNGEPKKVNIENMRNGLNSRITVTATSSIASGGSGGKFVITSSNLGFGFTNTPLGTGTSDSLSPNYISLKVRKANNSIVQPSFTHHYESGAWNKISIPTGSAGADLVASGDEIIIDLVSDESKFQQHTYYFIDGVNKGLVTEKNITVIRPYPLNAPKMTLHDSDRSNIVTNLSCVTPINTPGTNEGGFVVDMEQNQSFWTYVDNGGETRFKPSGCGPHSNPAGLTDIDGDIVKISYLTIGNGVTGLKAGDSVSLKAVAAGSGDELEVRVLLRGIWNETVYPTGMVTTGLDANNTWDCTIISQTDTMNSADNTGGIGSFTLMTWTASLIQPDALYLNEFVRFAYRWKYVDNEYSAISPFTEVAFLPPNEPYKFDAEEANNTNMQNNVRRIVFENFDNPDVDVKEIDLLFKTSDSTNIYVYKNIKNNYSWPGFLTITKESTVSLLEEKQLLRHYDNVPRVAKAQEVVGNRIVYANYKQQYNINDEDVSFSFVHEEQPVINNFPKLSIKSIRDYQLGVCYIDENGRQSSILTNSTNAVKKLDQRSSKNKNSFTATINSNHPVWATHYKYFIKESSSPYHNLSLDRFYRAKNENTVWLSFASSDVNKVKVDDYIILKKSHSSATSVSNISGKTVKYKVLAKETAAPTQIKARRRLYGRVTGNGQTPLFGSAPDITVGYPQPQKNFIRLNPNLIHTSVLKDIHTLQSQDPSQKYIRIVSTTGFASEYYEVESVLTFDGGFTNSPNSFDGIISLGGEGDYYQITVKEQFGEDMSFTGSTSSMIDDLTIEYYVSVDSQFRDEFDGRFFLKVAIDRNLENEVLDFVSSENLMLITNTQKFKSILSDDISINKQNGQNEYIGTVDNTTTHLDFLPRNSNAPHHFNQYWGVDQGYTPGTYINHDGQDLEPRQGLGAIAGATKITLKWFGEIGLRDLNRDSWFPPTQRQFFPDSYTLYNSLKRPGTKFKWENDNLNTIYTIESVRVEQTRNWLAGSANTSSSFTNKSVRFTITLDKPIVNPPVSMAANTILCSNNNGTNVFNASFGTNIEILENARTEQTFHSDSPAVFEVEPTEKIDLNLYHETCESILIPKVGMKISSANVNFNTTTISALSSDNLSITLAAAIDSTSIPAGTIVTIEENILRVDDDGDSRNYKQDFVLQHDAAASATILSISPDKIRWFNCVSFGNGVESNRIKDDFNQVTIDNGPKVSTILDAPYQEEQRKSSLIYSGLFNAKSSFNESNQFITAEKITKDLNPTYGSIQKLYSRNTNLLAFCEDKTIKILANKDALFNADNNVNLTATNRVLGQSIPFAGEYGISKNPESFANFGNRCYYSDRNRGAIIRLSGDGITNIAEKGMTNYFKTNLEYATKVIGSYDKDADLYNVTLKQDSLTTQNKTLSFTEKTNGWTSFLSFIPECGMSLNGKYYTCSDGELYQHHADSGNSNTFYGTFAKSKIKFVFNDEPSTIKQFKTIGYEGSDSRLYSKTISSETSLETNDFLTEVDGKGWYVGSIETNEGSGNVPDFVEKEGKWFNNIKGIATTEINLDTKESSTQGLSFPGVFTSGSLPVSINNLIVGNITCIGSTGHFGVVLIGPTNMTWWWNSKWSFIIVKSESNGLFTEPGFLNADYEYALTSNNGTNNLKLQNANGLNRSINYTFNGLREGYYKIFAKEFYTGLVIATSATHIAATQPLVSNGVVHTHASANADDAVIRVTPSLGSGTYTNAKISVNADMSSPTTDTSLAGTAPSQFFSFSSLASGTYYFTASDSSNVCGATTTAIQSLLVERAQPVSLVVSTNNSASCNILDPFSSVGNNLSKNASVLTLTASGGSGQYQYSVSNDASVFNFGSSSTSTTFTTSVPTPSIGHFCSVRDTQDQVASLVTVRFDQPDSTTKIVHAVVLTHASNQAGNNGVASFTVTGANQGCTVVVKKCDNVACSSQTTVATITLSESNGVFTGEATGLTGVAPNIFTSPITQSTSYSYEVTDTTGCRADAPIGTTFPTGSGSGVFQLSNTFSVVSNLSKVYYKVYDLEINSNHLLGYSNGLYPTQSSANFWITPLAGNTLTHYFTPSQNPNALWRNAYLWRNLIPELQVYNVDVSLFKIESQGNNVVDAADFSVVTSGGIGQLNGDGEHTSPAISNPGAIENVSGLTAPNITFTNSQTLNGTVADQNNYITVIVPLNFTMPASQQKILFHIIGTAYLNSLIA